MRRRRELTLCAVLLLASCGRPYFFVEFTEGGTGWIVGERAYRTSDGGTTWQRMPTNLSLSVPDEPSPSFDRGRLGLVNDKVGFAIFEGTQSRPSLFGTRDGGKEWREIAQGITSPFVFDEKGYGFAYRETKQLVRTRNAGTTWEEVGTELFSQLVLHDGLPYGLKSSVVMVSGDQGLTWRESRRFRSWLTRIKSSPAGLWVLSAHRGCSLLADDGSWRDFPLQDDEAGTLRDVAFRDGVLITVDSEGQVWRAQFPDMSWSRLESPSRERLWGVAFTAKGDLYVVGGGLIAFSSKPHVWRTRDLQTWAEVSLP